MTLNTNLSTHSVTLIPLETVSSVSHTLQTEDDAQRSIKLHKNEWLTIFGVKEEE